MQCLDVNGGLEVRDLQLKLSSDSECNTFHILPGEELIMLLTHCSGLSGIDLSLDLRNFILNKSLFNMQFELIHNNVLTLKIIFQVFY